MQSVNQFLSGRVKLVFLHHPLIMGYNSRKFGMTLSGRNYITCKEHSYSCQFRGSCWAYTS